MMTPPNFDVKLGVFSTFSFNFEHPNKPDLALFLGFKITLGVFALKIPFRLNIP